MSGLVEFLRARLDEDEAVAMRASNAPWTALMMYPTRSEVTNETEIDGGVIVRTPSKDDADAEHIARHDPARVLAEVEAKRAIVEDHYFMGRHESRDFGFEDGNCVTCRRQGPCPTLKHLASVYAGHPDYREEWKP